MVLTDIEGQFVGTFNGHKWGGTVALGPSVYLLKMIYCHELVQFSILGSWILYFGEPMYNGFDVLE